MASKFLVDSHIHLFRAEDLPTLSWMTPSSPLNAAHSVPEYVSSVSHHVSPRRPLGFVFIETDRKSHLAADDSGWAHPLREFAFANTTDVLGIVPWAPVPSGRAAMQRYRRRLADSRLLKGFRYLLQSHPRGTMLQAPFVDSLRWMGEERLVFELTVDCRGVGLWQLEEAVELLRRAHDGVAEERKLSLIVGAYSPPLLCLRGTRRSQPEDHLAKPDLHVAPADIPTSPFFRTWKAHLVEIARFSGTYIKLSGAFSELPPALLRQPQTQSRAEWIADIAGYVQPWVFAALDIFGARRVIWGSDWPVCTVNGGKEMAWALWAELTEHMLRARGLREDEMDAVWGGNSVRAYRIEVKGVGSRI